MSGMSPEAVCGRRASLVAFEREYAGAKSADDSTAAAASTLAPTTPGAAPDSPAPREERALAAANGDSDDGLAELQLGELLGDGDAAQCYCCAAGAVRL